MGDKFHHDTADGLLPVYCWCEGQIVRVDSADIKAGRTTTCGKSLCHQTESSPAA